MVNKAKELERYIESVYGDPRYVYLDLYIKKVRLIVYSEEFNQYIENQIPFILMESIPASYDTTIVLWKETDEKAPDIISEYDSETETYYYGVKNLEYEEFIKQGHFLVQLFYKILKGEHSSLVHGAVVGVDDNGVLICARGQRGKSTLTVLSMYMGMEYVSDDYLFVEEDAYNQLYASPIYSIITLSPFMAEQLKNHLVNSIKLGNNARKDKYIYNISNMHNMFRKHYPIKVIIFPEILDIDKPFIRKATSIEKGRAITQLVHSTMSQMNDVYDKMTTKKLMRMVNQYQCYYIGLSKNILENSKLLKEFIEKGEY